MGKAILVVLVIFMLSGCAAPASNREPARPATQQPLAAAAPADPCAGFDASLVDRYRPGSEIEVHHVPGIGCWATENGQLNGVGYSINVKSKAARFYAQASDPGDNDLVWIVNCKTDSMTDRQQCTIVRGDFFLFWQDGYSISLLGDKYPHTQVMFRVDSSSPITAREDRGITGGAAQRLLGQMQDGRILRTRYTNWPYATHRESTIELAGFTEALAYMQHLRQL